MDTKSGRASSQPTCGRWGPARRASQSGQPRSWRLGTMWAGECGALGEACTLQPLQWSDGHTRVNLLDHDVVSAGALFVISPWSHLRLHISFTLRGAPTGWRSIQARMLTSWSTGGWLRCTPQAPCWMVPCWWAMLLLHHIVCKIRDSGLRIADIGLLPRGSGQEEAEKYHCCVHQQLQYAMLCISATGESCQLAQGA